MSGVYYLILSLGGGLLGAFLVYWFVARRLFRRGYRLWGWLNSLIILGLIFVAGEFPLARDYHAAFSRIGICSICYEWSGMPFLFYYSSWMFGMALFILLSIVATVRSARQGVLAGHIFPKSAVWWLVGLICLLSATTAVAVLPAQLQRQNLVEKLPQVEGRIVGLPLKEVGALSLPWQFPAMITGNGPYVMPGGMQFSPDGSWLGLWYNRRLELRRMSDLKRALSLPLSTNDIFFAFSPDSSLLVLWQGRSAVVYSLTGDTPQLAWRSAIYDYSTLGVAFNETGATLILSQPEEVIQLDAVSGDLVERITFRKPERYSGLFLSSDGKYLAGWNGLTILIYERPNQQPLYEIPVATNLNENWYSFHSLFFLSPHILAFWNPYIFPDGEIMLIDCNTGESSILAARYYGSEYALLSPDERWLLEGTQQTLRWWDFPSRAEHGEITMPAAITAVTISLDQRLLAVATADGRVRFYRAE